MGHFETSMDSQEVDVLAELEPRLRERIREAAKVCEAAANGDLEPRILNIEGDDDFALMLRSLNHLLDMTDAFVRESVACMSSVQRGDYFRRILPLGMRGTFERAAVISNEVIERMGEAAQGLHAAEERRNSMVEDISTAKQVMDDLVTSTRDVEKMTDTIERIASQTNLLALNASIEAARVGHAGRGFAVVADEVKKLARQSAEATKDIKKNTGAMERASSQTVDSIGRFLELLVEEKGVCEAPVRDEQAV